MPNFRNIGIAWNVRWVRLFEHQMSWMLKSEQVLQGRRLIEGVVTSNRLYASCEESFGAYGMIGT